MKKLLVSNRGEIALRIMRTCKRLGIATVAIYSDADFGHPHTKYADQALRVGPASVKDSYLNSSYIIELAQNVAATAIHPGYGFLSENHLFAQSVIDAGLIFVGPSPDTLKLLGEKHAARQAARRVGLSLVPGYEGSDQSNAHLIKEAKKLGFPLMIKAAAGGGGKGMRQVTNSKELENALNGARREALTFFGNDRLILEKLIYPAKHIEVQLISDHFGNVLHLYERECSLQRRYQKVIEESPAPGLNPALRNHMLASALALAREVKLTNAATVEFLVPIIEHPKENDYFFLEVNPRIQVEHPVTELISNLDIVELQLRVAEGHSLGLNQNEIQSRGHAIEARVYAEVPEQDFRPSAGKIFALKLPNNSSSLRCDHALDLGIDIGTDYDPMLAKIIAHGKNRQDALNQLQEGLDQFRLLGVETNLAFLVSLLKTQQENPEKTHTAFISENIQQLTESPELEHFAMVAISALLLAEHCKPRSPFRLPFERPAHRFPSKSISHNNTKVHVFSSPLEYTIKSSSFNKNSPNPVEQYPAKQYKGRIVAAYPDHAYDIEINGQIHHIKFDPCSQEKTPNSSWHNLELRFDNTLYQPLIALNAPNTGHHLLNVGVHHFEVGLALDWKQELGQTSDHSTLIYAPLPGTIIQLNIKEGLRVTQGEPLIIIESMKMEHPVSASRDLIVKRILTTLGTRVNQGDLLLEFEAAKS